MEKQGLIQCFEYTHELAWKTLKDFLENQGFIDLIGPKDVIRQAVKLRVLAQGEIWLNMIESRRRISHVYDEKVVEEIVGLISKVYFSEFVSLNGKLNELKISS